MRETHSLHTSPLAPVRPRRRGDRQADPTAWVHEELRRMVLDGRIAVGRKIRQGPLAERLGVSRTPVVKALHKLESEGLVDSVPQTGFFVHRFTVADLRDLFALREAIEGMAASDLVATITEADVGHLAGLFRPFGRGGARIDAKDYAAADRAFHRFILQACRNELARKVDRTFLVLDRTFRAGLVREPAETLPEHRAIVAAVRAREADAARSAMISHISKTKDLLQRVIDSLRGLGVDPERLPVQEVPPEMLDRNGAARRAAVRCGDGGAG